MNELKEGSIQSAKAHKKGGSIPQRSAEKLRSLLPLASSQLLQKCHRIFLESFQETEESIAAELSLSEKEIRNEKIDSSPRKRTIIFKYPGNGHIYVALKFQTFSKVICSWMGAVQDCYILRTSSMKSNFQEFSGTKVLDLVNESDEEELPGDQPTTSQDYRGKMCHGIPEGNDIQKRRSHNHTLFGDEESDVELLRDKDGVVRNCSDTSNSD